MLQVKGLTTNLINISQLYDQVLNVSYNNSKCIVSNKDQVVLIKGSRSTDNCYMWISHPSTKVKSMKEIIFEDGVNGFPKLKIEDGKIHDACQDENKTKISFKMVQHLTHTSDLPCMYFMKLKQGVEIEGNADGQAGGPPNIGQHSSGS